MSTQHEKQQATLDELETTRHSGKTVRIITGSYEHNMLCVALTLSQSEVFTPIFHFTPHTASIRCLASSGKTLVSGANDEHIRLYDLAKRKEVGTLMHHSGQILCVEFYSKWLLSGAGDGQICLWRTKDWELMSTLKGHKGPVTDISVHPTGKIALSVADDGKLILWNLMTARKASTIKLYAGPLKVQWVPNSNTYVVGFDRKISLFKTSTPAFEMLLTSSLQQLRSWKEYMVVSYSNGKIDFFRWDTLSAEAKPEFTLHGHATRVKDFSILEDLMSSVSSDGKIVVWDLLKRDQVAVYSSGDRLNCVTMVPDEVEAQIKRVEPRADTDYETDAEEPKPKKQKKKKARVVIENK